MDQVLNSKHKSQSVLRYIGAKKEKGAYNELIIKLFYQQKCKQTITHIRFHLVERLRQIAVQKTSTTISIKNQNPYICARNIIFKSENRVP